MSSLEPRPLYRFPPYAILNLTSSIFFDWPKRSLYEDACWLLNTHQPRPVLTGNLPKQGPYLVVANHYTRPGLWIGWPGSLLAEAARTLHIVVTDSQQFILHGNAYPVPFSRYFMRRIAQLWGMIQMPADPLDTAGRAASLKRVLKTLRSGESVLFFPEGDRGSASGLVSALPGTGSLIALAARYAPVIPVAFWEEGATLRGHIGSALTITASDDAAVHKQVMIAIGQMLPAALWGEYHLDIAITYEETPYGGRLTR